MAVNTECTVWEMPAAQLPSSGVLGAPRRGQEETQPPSPANFSLSSLHPQPDLGLLYSLCPTVGPWGWGDPDMEERTGGMDWVHHGVMLKPGPILARTPT